MDGIDAETRERIEFAMRYGGVSGRDKGLLSMFDSWWAARANAPAWTANGKGYWKWRWKLEVALVERQILRENTNAKRCSGCGAKLRTRSCLACDLERKKHEAKIT